MMSAGVRVRDRVSRFSVMMMAVVLVAAAALLGSAAPSQAATVTGTVDGISYSGDDASFTATVTGYDPTFGLDVTIPGSVTLAGDTYTVTTIGDRAFHSARLTQVTFPDSLTTIGNRAFYENRLTQVTFPENVSWIGEYVFYENRLTQVAFPDGLTVIGDSAFAANSLTQVTLPDSLTSVGNRTFANNQLTQITIPDNVTSIDGFAFSNNRLAQVTISDSVTTIEPAAFSNNQLTQVAFPDSVTSIGYSAFSDNVLTQVTIAGSAISIDDIAFGGNAGLASVVFEGAAPSRFTAGVEGNSSRGSLGDPGTGVVVSYLKQFESTGFTSPIWRGYASLAILEDFTVTFDPQGGTVIDPVTVTDGDPVAAPADPTRAGYTFTGWYTSSDAVPSSAYDFTTPVTGALTLYAGWELVPAAVFTVTFDSQGGSAVASVPVTDGNQVSAPADPTRDGYTFTGWYTSTDADPTSAYDFSTPVAAAFALYAGWEAVPAAVITTPTPTPAPGPGQDAGSGEATGPGSNTGENRLAATGADPSFWLPVAATMLLTAGAFLLVARSRRGTQKA